jgi:cytochrome b6-f complex iron-sulfur subunit
MLLLTALVTPWDLVGAAVAAGVFLVTIAVIGVMAIRARNGTAKSTTGDAADELTRRQLVERGAAGLLAAALTGVVVSAIDYVATALGHPGRRYQVGSPDAVREHLATHRTPYYDAVGGFYVVPYPRADLGHAREAYTGDELDGMEIGFVALDQACTHLGCRVPYCVSSQWFECPCHGSRYNAVGEQRRGPAPRGLDRYPVTIEDGNLVVDTRRRILGPPPGTDTADQKPAGPHCY